MNLESNQTKDEQNSYLAHFEIIEGYPLIWLGRVTGKFVKIKAQFIFDRGHSNWTGNSRRFMDSRAQFARASRDFPHCFYLVFGR